MNELTDAERGYLAGIIDGEGYLGVQYAGKNLAVRLVVTSIDEALPLRLHAMTGIGTIAAQVLRPPRKPAFQWRVFRQADLRALLLSVQELVVIKGRQVRVALAAIGGDHAALLRARHAIFEVNQDRSSGRRVNRQDAPAA